MAKKVFGNTAKWSKGIQEQLEDLNQSDINTQFVPIEQIKLDPKNPRLTCLTLDDLKSGPKLPAGPFDEITQSTFHELVRDYFSKHNKSDQAVEEYMSIAYFASSIGKPENLINPVTGYMDGMNFQLIAGHRRTYAHMLMGASRVSAHILEHRPAALQVSLLQWGENADREDLSLFEQLQSISRIIQDWESSHGKSITLSDLISLLSLKRTRAKWLLKIHRNTFEELDNAILTGKIKSLELAYKIASISDKKEREYFIQESVSGRLTNPRKLSPAKGRSPTPSSSPSLKKDETAAIKHKIVLDGMNIVLNSPSGIGTFQSMIKQLNSTGQAVGDKEKKLWLEFTKKVLSLDSAKD